MWGVWAWMGLGAQRRGFAETLCMGHLWQRSRTPESGGDLLVGVWDPFF